MSPLMYQCLLCMREINPNLQLIYIGEMGGCNADNNFVMSANIIENKYIDNARSKFISWGGIHDTLFLIN